MWVMAAMRRRRELILRPPTKMDATTAGHKLPWTYATGGLNAPFSIKVMSAMGREVAEHV